MGLLDDLKKEADTLKNEQAVRTQSLKANAATVDRALRKTFYYLNDLFKQLNVVKPPCPREYDLQTVGKIDGLSQMDYRIDFRSSHREGSEHFENLTVNFKRSKPERLTVKRDAENIERFRDLLWQNNMRFTSDPIKNERRVTVSETFTINCEVICGVDVVGDYEGGIIRFKLKNVEDFGPTVYTLEPDSITDEALEAFATLLIGKESTFSNYNRRASFNPNVTAGPGPYGRSGVKVPLYVATPLKSATPEPAREEKKGGLLGSLKSVFKRESE
jgi:hypothetical protein